MSQNHCKWKAPTVTLANGEQVPSDSVEWLKECEARAILDLPTKQARLDFLDKIEKRRGEPARKDLERRILELWSYRRGEVQ